MATTFLPIPFRISMTRRVVWLFPTPVRLAVTEITGFVDLIIVLLGPMS